MRTLSGAASPNQGFYDLRSVDAHGTPGHRRGNAEEVLATNRKRGGSHEEKVRQQLIKVLWAEYSPPPTQVGNVAGIQRNTGCSMNGVTALSSAASPNQVF